MGNTGKDKVKTVRCQTRVAGERTAFSPTTLNQQLQDIKFTAAACTYPNAPSNSHLGHGLGRCSAPGG